MKRETIEQREPTPSAEAERRELDALVERLERRVAAMMRRTQAAEDELRRQRASGRRP